MSNKVIDVLMNRDGMTKKEAINHLNEVRRMLEEPMSCGDYEECEEIIASELGLEMDYVFDILNL